METDVDNAHTPRDSSKSGVTTHSPRKQMTPIHCLAGVMYLVLLSIHGQTPPAKCTVTGNHRAYSLQPSRHFQTSKITLRYLL